MRTIAFWSLGIWTITRALLAVLTLATSSMNHWYFWDAGHFLGIARSGYAAVPVRAVYYPLYPLLGRAFFALGWSYVPAMLLPSNVALLAALLLVGLLVAYETGSERAAVLAMLLLAVSPEGVFLSGMYPEGLFIALAAGAWLAARSYHWRIAGVLLGLAIITRPFGLVLGVALLVEYFCQGQSWKRVLWLVVPPVLTFGLFLLGMWYMYGNPLEPFTLESSRFGHALLWPWQTLILQAQELIGASAGWPTAHMLLDVLPLLLTITVVAVVARRWPPAFTVYVGTCVLLVLITPVVTATGQYALISAGRYLYAAAPLLLIPLACTFTSWPRVAQGAVLAASFALQIGLTLFVLRGGWLV